jgi:hypothetical protein
MNRRVLSAAIAVLLVLPASAAAQLTRLPGEERSGPRFGLTPFVAHLAAFGRIEDWTHQDGVQTTRFRAVHDVAAGTMLGLNLEVPIVGRLGLIAAGGYGARDRTVFRVDDEGPFQLDGNKVTMVRAGLLLHLAQDPSELVVRGPRAAVYAGGVALREEPRNALGTAEFVEEGTHTGINLGLMAELPFGQDRFAVQAAIEDNVVWWDTAQLESLAYEYLGRPGDRSQTTVITEISHVWLLRAGLTIRLF